MRYTRFVLWFSLLAFALSACTMAPSTQLGAGAYLIYYWVVQGGLF